MPSSKDKRQCADSSIEWDHDKGEWTKNGEVLSTEQVDCLHVAWDVSDRRYHGGHRYTERRECTDCRHAWRADCDVEPPNVAAKLLRTEFQGVSYSVGGKVYEIMVHPDVSVFAEDGILKVDHGGGGTGFGVSHIHGIVGVRPIYTVLPAGEEQSDESVAEEPEG